MDALDLIKTRRSVRKYKSEMPSDDQMKKCIEAACSAPSAHNSQPWKFVVVKDRESIEKLARTQTHSRFLLTAPVVIVALGDEAKSPGHWIEDCSCAIMLLMLEASSLGLGTCWNAVYDSESTDREEYVRSVLKIPKKYRVIANIGLGYPDEKPWDKKIMSFSEATKL
jgi:nitroreductase